MVTFNFLGILSAPYGTKNSEISQCTNNPLLLLKDFFDMPNNN